MSVYHNSFFLPWMYILRTKDVHPPYILRTSSVHPPYILRTMDIQQFKAFNISKVKCQKNLTSFITISMISSNWSFYSISRVIMLTLNQILFNFKYLNNSKTILCHSKTNWCLYNCLNLSKTNFATLRKLL